MEDMMENKWAVRLLKANGPIMLDLLALAAKETSTPIDDGMLAMLDPQIRSWLEGLEIPEDIL